MANATTAADYLQGDTAIKSTEKYPGQYDVIC